MSEVKQKNPVKNKLIRRILFKYSLLLALVLELILIIFFILSVSYVFFGLSIISAIILSLLCGIYDGKYIFSNYTNLDYVKGVLQYFSEEKMGFFAYSESLIWFSGIVQYSYRQKKDDYNDYDQLINALHRILRNENGLCYAIHYQNEFMILAGQLLNEMHSTQNYNKRIDDFLIQTQKYPIHHHKKTWFKKSAFLEKSTFKTLMVYVVIIIMHIGGCLLLGNATVPFNNYEFWGNVCLAIPSDILLILVFKGWVKEKE